MIQLIVPELFIYSVAVDDVMPPRLEPDMLEWFVSSNISDYELVWTKRDPDPNVRSLNRGLTIWDTTIIFHNDRDATLFKLRWHAYQRPNVVL